MFSARRSIAVNVDLARCPSIGKQCTENDVWSRETCALRSKVYGDFCSGSFSTQCTFFMTL